MSNALIGKKLRELRGEIPRAEVAEAVGISISALTMYETGQRIPRDQIKVKLAEFYNTTVQELFFTPEQHNS